MIASSASSISVVVQRLLSLILTVLYLITDVPSYKMKNPLKGFNWWYKFRSRWAKSLFNISTKQSLQIVRQDIPFFMMKLNAGFK